MRDADVLAQNRVLLEPAAVEQWLCAGAPPWEHLLRVCPAVCMHVMLGTATAEVVLLWRQELFTTGKIVEGVKQRDGKHAAMQKQPHMIQESAI